MAVIKKDGRREPFNRAKLASGLHRAVEKRPVATAKVEEVIDLIERQLRSSGDSEIEASRIGELVMAALLELDEVAYVRFASVYRSFTDVAAFETELARIKSRGRP